MNNANMNALTNNESRIFDAAQDWLLNSQDFSEEGCVMADIYISQLWGLSVKIMKHGTPIQKKNMLECAAASGKIWNMGKWEDEDKDDEEDDEEQEINGTCYECGIEGKFLGEEGDDWLCINCCSLGGEKDDEEDDDEEQQ